MVTMTTGFERAAAPQKSHSAKEAVSQLRRILLDAVDRLVPPQHDREERELPPEWFRYPPF